MNFYDFFFSSRMAAGNYLIGIGMTELAPDKWLGKDQSARVESENGKIRVRIRKRDPDKKRVR